MAASAVATVAELTQIGGVLPGWLDPKMIIPTVGFAGILIILFAETGLLIGFFLPGDSLLFTAGLFATATGYRLHAHLNLPLLMICCPIAAIAGAQLGHYIGVHGGRRLFDRRESRLFKHEYVERAEHYFEKFGPARAVVLARFIPIVRTFLNPVAGILDMPARRFLLCNAVGGVLWTEGVLLLGYFLGKTISGVDRFLLPAIALIVVVSLVPITIELIRARRAMRRPKSEPAGDQRDSVTYPS